MLTHEQVGTLRGATAYDRDGSKIGTVEQVYLDDTTGTPEWATVRTGLFGLSESFVPLAEADLRDDGLVVAAGKDAVKNAPRVDADLEDLSPDEEAQLYRYYGLTPDDSAPRPDTQTEAMTEAGTEHAADTGGDAMTRSEEHLRVDTERRTAGRARLRRYVATENVE